MRFMHFKGLVMCLLLLSALGAAAQKDADRNNKDADARPPYLRNIVKMNLSSLAFNNYHFAYERLIGRKTSVQLAYRHMPETNLGDLKLSDKLVSVAEDDELKDDLNLIRAGNKTITAEIRFYGGRKDGAKGVYLGLYGRYAAFTTNYQYEYNTGMQEYQVPLQSEYKGIGGGLLLGAQFALAKRVMVDLYLLGGHYGKVNGDVKSATNLSALTPAQRQELKNELDDLIVVGENAYLSTQVSNTGVTGTVSGPFAGIRGLGLSIGIAF